MRPVSTAPHLPTLSVLRRPALRLLVLLTLFAAVPTAWAYSVQFQLTPLDAAVFVDGTKVEKPTIKAGFVKVSLSSQKGPHQIRFERAGYEPLTIAVTNADDGKKQVAALTELRTVKVRVSSDCRDARVALITESGTTDWGPVPATKEITMRRPGGSTAWTPWSFSVSATDYQTEIVRLTAPDQPNLSASLSPLHEVVSLPVAAVDDNGQPLAIVARVDDKTAGTGVEPKVALDFRRENKDKPWNEHTVSVEDPHGVFQSAAARVAYAQRNTPLRFTLKPVKEALLVPRMFPRVGFSSGRPAQEVDRTSVVAMLDTEEPCPAAAEVVRITNFGQRDKQGAGPVEHLNSFALSPDGKYVILAVTTETPAGLASSLYVKNADKDAREKHLLLENPGYVDMAPAIAPDGEDALVFQSNRVDRTKPDLFCIRLAYEGNELTTRGGLVQLTSGSWFNFAPAPGAASSAEIVFLTADPLGTGALPQVKTVRLDGTVPTTYPLRGSHVNVLERRKVVLTNEDPATHRTRIISASLDARGESVLTSAENLAAANCSMAAVSLGKPRRILFVSDCEKTPKGRPQNDLFVMTAEGAVRRLTANESDDLMPAWSPLASEPDVVYFLSNRGGAYNVWRLRIVAGN